jgi:membrane-associated protease RseP (regulator of RpoE activity)
MSATDTNQGEGSAPGPRPGEQGVDHPLAFGLGHATGPGHVVHLDDEGEAPSEVVQVVQSNPMRLLAVIAAIVALGVFVSLPAVIVVLALVFMIFMHELGHYLTAKRAGMLVTEFFIGFGPRIWSFRKGEVEYGLKAIPAGAYVRIIGMNNLEEVDPADEPRTYRQQPFWQRFSVAVAGSTMHFLMAFVLLFIIFAGFGERNLSIWSVDEITPSADLAPQNGESVESPAEVAGLQPGDRIIRVDDDRIGEFTDLKNAIESRPGETVTLVIRRDGETIEATTTLLTSGPDGDEKGFLGIAPSSPRQRLGVLPAAQRAGSEFVNITTQSVASLGRFFSPSGISNFFDQTMTANDPQDPSTSAEEPAPSADDNRIVSIYGAGRIGTQAAEAGVVTLLFFLALLNIFIGVFNLVPLLPLDGGHVSIAIYEKFREWRQGNKRRYFADITKMLPVTYGVVVVLITVGAMALYMDVINPINLPN